MRSISHQCFIVILILCERAAAVDTSFLPRMSPAEEAAVVQVLDDVESTSGTGFVIGTDSNGYPLVLTNQHTVEGGFIRLKLSDGTVVRDVDVVATDVLRDLGLLRVKIRRPVIGLELAPRTYSVARETPIVAIGASALGLLHHVGTFENASEFNHESTDAVFASGHIFTPSGFSGGPVLVVDPTTRQLLVIAVTAKGSATHSSGPWISEIRDWLKELRPITGPITFSQSRRHRLPRIVPENETFPGMFADDEPHLPTTSTPPTPSTAASPPTPPTKITPATSSSITPPRPTRTKPSRVHHLPTVSSRVSVVIRGNGGGVLIYADADSTQHLYWDTPSACHFLQQQRNSQ